MTDVVKLEAFRFPEDIRRKGQHWETIHVVGTVEPGCVVVFEGRVWGVEACDHPQADFRLRRGKYKSIMVRHTHPTLATH